MEQKKPLLSFTVEYQIEPLAQGIQDVHSRHEANRISWNQGAQRYTEELEDTIKFLRAGNSNLHPVERRNLGDLRAWCRTAIHLQCASGRDTLSLWNEGVSRVIGVDISDVHIANARRITEALQAPATWYRCDVLDTPHELDGIANLVYTGRGALCWLHDLNRWAEVIFRLLTPGGVLHVLDDHPLTWLFDPEQAAFIYSGFDYFVHSESSQGWTPNYIGDLGIPIKQHARKFERLWPIAEVFQALRRAGLTTEYFGEHPEAYWNSFPHLKPELIGRIPMTFSLLARKP